eukprot:200388_1
MGFIISVLVDIAVNVSYLNRVIFDSCSSQYDTKLYFYNNNFNELNSCDDCGSCGINEQLTIESLSNGIYYLGVGGYSNKYGSYHISVTCSFITPTVTTSTPTSVTTSPTSMEGILKCNNSISSSTTHA